MGIKSKVLALADVTVTDVVNKFIYPPLSLSTSQLPAQTSNYDNVLDFADNVNDALKTSRATLGAVVDWTIAATTGIDVAGVSYWGIVASVTMRG